MSNKRNEVAQENRWNVEALYPNYTIWEGDLKKLIPGTERPFFPAFSVYRGRLGESAAVLKEALDLLFKLSRNFDKLHTYAHLRHDEDITNDAHKSSYGQISAFAHAFAQEASWFEPELLGLPDETLKAYLQSPVLADYHFYLQKIMRLKEHTLTPEKEELVALARQAMQSPYKTFNAINDADFKFGSVTDSEGNEHEITHGLFHLYLRDRDRTLRENAFKKLHKKYFEYENTLCEMLQGVVQGHFFDARAHHYDSCLKAALYPNNIDTSVYHSLISAVDEGIGALHKYIGLRKRVLGLNNLHLYDLYVPLTPDFDIKMNYAEAEKAVIESVAPLGKEYQDTLRKGFYEQRWVDRYENQNKRSGAYSSGCFDSMPYILMNYKEQLRDVFTLAHEAGHSMHSFYSRGNQPYHYSDYSIFLAEVASTFNEDLLTRYLLAHAKTKEEKIFLINQKIEDIRTTLFRQTMFAEFELFIHDNVEQNIPLTPKLLKDEYLKLNKKYFGPDVVIDDDIMIEWSRIPHFYYNFYVYQYATGISAALALADRVMKGGTKERDEYLNFLKSGSSRYPIEILQGAGVDMRSPDPVKTAIKTFNNLVDELEKLIFSS